MATITEGKPLTREDFATEAGRRRAVRELMFADHGLIRLFHRNVHEVAPGKLWRSHQPSPAEIARWAARGVRTIVNLRGDKPSGFLFLEEEACAKARVRHIPLRAFSREAPPKEFLKRLRALFGEIEYPALMHCKSGADRVGIAATLYLFFEEGVALDEAMRQQLSFRYGHVRQGKTGVIDYALERYLEHARTAGVSLADVDAFMAWAESPAYDPVALKREFMGSWWGNLLTERILRRE
ncbi:MAG: tyrosine-protein phosphatase [Parvularculaceae bacterium]|nr:tyrosine-protein phosphatase [Parvularculaceae bacterium]